MSRPTTTSERDTLAEFRTTFEHCWGCGISDGPRWNGIDYPRWLEVHHMMKRGRVTERWNLSMLCKLCHDLAEGHCIKHHGERLPNLSLANCLWLKRRFDRKHCDRVQLLAHSRTRFLPRAEKPPEFFGNLWLVNVGSNYAYEPEE